MSRPTLGILVASVIVTALVASAQNRPASKTRIAIAHRGASAYAPEHTLAAYRLAVAQGADYVEQDLALTSDGVLICLHDESLERTTNVEDVFPDRATRDPATGRWQWLVADFTLDEIKRLDAGRWFHEKFTGERIPTWEETVAAVDRRVGLYPELKTPGRYRDRGISIARTFAESLARLGLPDRPGRVIVQSFEAEALRELAVLLPAVPRTFLIDTSDGPRWLSPTGLHEIAAFATGIGPSKLLIDGRPEIVERAHTAGLDVTPYTFTTRGRATRFGDVAAEMQYYLSELGVDALFTDNPDRFPR